MTEDVCQACGKRIVLVNLDKMRGVVGLTMGWVHVSRLGRAKLRARHRPIPTEYLNDEAKRL